MFQAGSGCSTSVTPISASAGIARTAVASSQAWFASTISVARPSSAAAIRRSRARSSASGCAPILILKRSCRRAASFASASSISCAGSPEASVQKTGIRSRTTPPSSCTAGTPSVRPTASKSALSIAALAALLRFAAASMRAAAASNRLASSADHGRREMGVDDGLDALDALLAPARAAEGGGLADAGRAVRQPDLDDDVALGGNRELRELVLPHRRHVDDGAADVGDGRGRAAGRREA